MKILVINIHSTANAGDAVLLAVTLQQLQRLFPGCSLTLSMNDPASYQGSEAALGSFTAWFKTCSPDRSRWRIGPLLLLPWLLFVSLMAALVYRRWRRLPSLWLTSAQRNLLQAYTDADLVVSCPGNFLYSSGLLGIPFLLTIATIAYAWLVGKPIYMMPQTIGPLRRQWEFRLVRWLLPKIRVILLREQNSLALLNKLGLHHPCCQLVPDLAFLFVGDPPASGRALLTELNARIITQGPLLGVTLLNWGAQNRRFTQQLAYEQAMARVIEAFIAQHGGYCFLFPQVHGPTAAEDDRIPARRVASQVEKFRERVIVIERKVTPAQLKAAYAQMDLFIGTRLHSNIFALTADVPVVAIAYQYKTHGIMQMLELSAWVVDIEAVDEAKLTALLQALWMQRALVRENLRASMPEIQQQIYAALAQIKTDYAVWKAG